MMSLSARLLIASSIVLSAFLGLTGYALDKTFQQSSIESEEEKLLGHVMTIIAVAPVKLDGTIHLPESFPLANFSQLGSGLYSEIVDNQGNIIWSSVSLGDNSFPVNKHDKVTEMQFDMVKDSTGVDLFRLSYGVSWDSVRNTNIYTINIAETTDIYNQEVKRFRQLLWFWLGGVSIILLAAQGIILRWSLSPLRNAAHEIVDIEKGLKENLEGNYPRELRLLTRNINAFIRSNKAHLTRHRNALSDLAHSLKTPLALVRNASEDDDTPSSLKSTTTSQVDRMQKIIDYQLQRAATSGKIPLTKPVAIQSIVSKIMNSLAKVYREKSVRFNIDIADSALFYGDESDLFEMLGNLLDNAFRWCKGRVFICTVGGNNHAEYLEIIVEDDGPGIDKELSDSVLERGVYSPKKGGTGIGLAIVQDIVSAYEGDIKITRSKLGGACFRLKLRHVQEIA